MRFSLNVFLKDLSTFNNTLVAHKLWGGCFFWGYFYVQWKHLWILKDLHTKQFCFDLFGFLCFCLLSLMPVGGSESTISMFSAFHLFCSVKRHFHIATFTSFDITHSVFHGNKVQITSIFKVYRATTEGKGAPWGECMMWFEAVNIFCFSSDWIKTMLHLPIMCTKHFSQFVITGNQLHFCRMCTVAQWLTQVQTDSGTFTNWQDNSCDV